MKRLFLSLAIASFAQAQEPGLPASPAAVQLEIHTDVEQVKQGLESKVLRTLETYLGERSKVIVSAQLRMAEPTNPEANASAVGEDNWVDLGYVTTPGESLGPSAQSKFALAGTDLDVRVSDKLDDETVRQVQSLAVNALQGFNPNVRVVRVSFPEPIKEAPKEDSKSAQAPSPEPMTPVEKMLNRYGALVPLLAAIVAGLWLFLASNSASKTIAESASEIAAGIRSMRPQVSTNPDKPLTVAGLGAENEGKQPDAKVPPVPPRLREHARNIALVKRMLVENPLPFVRSLTDTPADRKGLKWLLINLSDEERSVLKRFLGVEKLAALAQAGDEPEAESIDPSTWLQDVVENLVIRDIAGGSVLERALSSDQALRLSSASADELFRVVESLGDVAAWRVALEFLPKDRILAALKGSDASLWQRIVSGSELAPEALRDGAAKIVAQLGDAKAEEGRNGAADERKRFYSNILLDPAVDSVLAKPLGEDDQFLDELSQMAPEFVSLLRRKVWTPRSLDLVTDAALKESFSPLSPAQKTAVLLVMPEAASERLQAFLPEGTGRTIVLDQLRKARERGDEGEFESATRLAREFMDFLRKQADAGRLAMVERGEGATPEREAA